MDDRTNHTLTQGAGMGESVFLTGGTGLLGSQIVGRILRRHPGTRLTLLVRPSRRGSARARVDKLLRDLLDESEANEALGRVHVVEGDIANPAFAVGADLAAHIDQVIHCAATVRFDLPLEEARRHNTEGTRNVLTFAARLPRLRRFDYVGTAYVAGRRAGTIKEDELDVGQGFWNSYEQTKMEAEKLVRAFGASHPTAIYRPSIIVGDSRTGQITGFQGLYQVLPLYSRSLIFAIPANPETHVDLVPIDYVLDALFAMMGTDRSIGRCFHLASGPGSTCTIDEIVGMLADFTKVERPPYLSFENYQRFVRPIFHSVLWGKRRAAMLKGEHYLPYLSSKCAFDKANTDECLAAFGIRVPHPTSYFSRLLAFQARTPGRGLAAADRASQARARPGRDGATQLDGASARSAVAR
jgi:thioester reductase-like protein